MHHEIIAKRYAKALISACSEKKDLDKVVSQFEGFVQTFIENNDLHKALTSPAIPPSKKETILTNYSKKANLHAILRNFLVLLNEKGRITAIEDIHSAFIRLLNDRAGIVNARLFYATKPSKDDQSSIVKQLKRITGKEIALDMIEEPELIAGVMIKIDGTIYDGSLKNKFQMLRKHLTGE